MDKIFFLDSSVLGIVNLFRNSGKHLTYEIRISTEKLFLLLDRTDKKFCALKTSTDGKHETK